MLLRAEPRGQAPYWSVTEHWLLLSLISAVISQHCVRLLEGLGAEREAIGQEMRKNLLCSVSLQDEEKRKQARSLLEESSRQGCLISSYLLWESDRKVDVSGASSGVG